MKPVRTREGDRQRKKREKETSRLASLLPKTESQFLQSSANGKTTPSNWKKTVALAQEERDPLIRMIDVRKSRLQRGFAIYLFEK
jgi:hypothetical protein